MSEVLRNLTEKEANEMKADLKKCGCGLFSDYDLGPYDIHEGISNPIMSSVGGAKYNDQGMWIPARDIALAFNGSTIHSMFPMEIEPNAYASVTPANLADLKNFTNLVLDYISHTLAQNALYTNDKVCKLRHQTLTDAEKEAASAFFDPEKEVIFYDTGLLEVPREILDPVAASFPVNENFPKLTDRNGYLLLLILVRGISSHLMKVWDVINIYGDDGKIIDNSIDYDKSAGIPYKIAYIGLGNFIEGNFVTKESAHQMTIRFRFAWSSPDITKVRNIESNG